MTSKRTGRSGARKNRGIQNSLFGFGSGNTLHQLPLESVDQLAKELFLFVEQAHALVTPALVGMGFEGFLAEAGVIAGLHAVEQVVFSNQLLLAVVVERLGVRQRLGS